MAPSNAAAWLTAYGKVPLEVKHAAYPSPGQGEVVVKNAAVAVNPADWKLQSHAIIPLNYPIVLGEDIAGEWVEVGSGVKKLQAGDRVIGCTRALALGNSAYGGFQNFTVIPETWTAKIPAEIPLSDASVLPLAVATAAAALFQENFLALPSPTTPVAPATGQIVVIWGGSSSVGAVGIQLARAAGIEVITTASPHNFELVKSLGASQVFDHNSASVADDIIAALTGRNFAGVFDAVSLPESQGKVSKIAAKYGVFVALTLNADAALIASGVQAEDVNANSIEHNHVLEAVWGHFLGPALASGDLKPTPPAQIIGHGLEYVQSAFDANKNGLSARKAVVTLG